MSERQLKACRRNAWKGGRQRSFRKVVAFYLSNECREFLRHELTNNSGLTGHDLKAAISFLELELVRRELARDIRRRGVLIEYSDGKVRDNPSLVYLVKISHLLGYTADQMGLTRRASSRRGAQFNREVPGGGGRRPASRAARSQCSGDGRCAGAP